MITINWGMLNYEIVINLLPVWQCQVEFGCHWRTAQPLEYDSSIFHATKKWLIFHFSVRNTSYINIVNHNSYYTRSFEEIQTLIYGNRTSVLQLLENFLLTWLSLSLKLNYLSNHHSEVTKKILNSFLKDKQ